MVRVKKEITRSDLSEKAQPKKAQNKKNDPNYEAYQHWIKSKAFKQLREKALERDGYRCACCGRTAEEIIESGKKNSLQAHHKSYENCGKGNEEELADLIVLDAVCHRAIHSAKSNLRRFTDKSKVKENIEKFNPNLL